MYVVKENSLDFYLYWRKYSNLILLHLLGSYRGWKGTVDGIFILFTINLQTAQVPSSLERENFVVNILENKTSYNLTHFPRETGFCVWKSKKLVLRKEMLLQKVILCIKKQKSVCFEIKNVKMWSYIGVLTKCSKQKIKAKNSFCSKHFVWSQKCQFFFSTFLGNILSKVGTYFFTIKNYRFWSPIWPIVYKFWHITILLE